MSRRIFFFVSAVVCAVALSFSSTAFVFAESGSGTAGSTNSGPSTTSGSGNDETTSTGSTPFLIDDVRSDDIEQTSAKIAWSTSFPASSKVEYGVAIGVYDHLSTTMCDDVVQGSDYVTEHCVVITGMNPDTLYFYKIHSYDQQQNGVFATSNLRTISAEEATTTENSGNGSEDTGDTNDPAGNDSSSGDDSDSGNDDPVTTTPPPPPPPEKTTGTISGTVRDQFGGAIESAYLQIFPTQSAGATASGLTDIQEVFTNNEGEYSLEVEKGDWVVSLIITSTTAYTSSAPSAEISVFADKTTTQDFTVSIRDAVISGEIHSTDNILVEDFSGVAYANRVDGNESYTVEVSQGLFTMSVSTGTYEVSVSPYAGTQWVTQGSATVTAVPGGTQSVLLTVEQKTSTISGFLVDSFGQPVIGSTYTVVASGEQGQRQETQSDATTGGYTLSVASGTWFVQAHVADSTIMPLYRPKPVATRIDLDPGKSVRHDLPLERASGVIVGRVLSSSGTPTANVWVRASSKTVSTLSSGTNTSDADVPVGVYTGSDGLFRFNVPLGTYFVRAYGATTDNEVNPHERRVVVTADDAKEIVLQFKQTKTVLNGTVLRDGVGTRGYVTAWSELGGYRETHSDDNGAYSLQLTQGDTWHVSSSARHDGHQYKSSVSHVSTGQFNAITRNLSLERERVLPPPVTHKANASEARVVRVSDGAKVAVPSAGISTTGSNTITVAPDAESPEQGDARVVGIGYDIQAFDNNGASVSTLLDDMTITIPYDADELTALGITPRELTIAYWDEKAEVWLTLATSVVNESDKTVTATIAHLTRFAIVSAADIVPPNAPTSIEVSIAGSQAQLSWNNPTVDFNHAKIYRATVQGDLGTMIATDITGSTYTDTVENGAMYYYTVRAVDPAGNESTNTDQVAASVTETTITSIADKLRGTILLQVEANGEAWYVHPDRATRYFLGRPRDAFEVMRLQGLGVSNANIATIQVGIKSLSGADDDEDGLSNLFEDAIGSDSQNADTDGDTFDDETEVLNGFNVHGEGAVALDRNLAKQVSGKILLQVEQNGESWYVYPNDEKRYFLGRPHDAFTVMRELGLGITNADLAQIPIAPDSATP